MFYKFENDSSITYDKSIKHLEEFHAYVGKGIQSFYSKIPNICAHSEFEWLRIERFIEFKERFSLDPYRLWMKSVKKK